MAISQCPGKLAISRDTATYSAKSKGWPAAEMSVRFCKTWSSSAILFNCNSHDHPVSVPQQTSSACLPSFHFRSFRFNTCFDLTHALVVPRWTSARGIPAVSSASPMIAPPASILQCITPCCAKLMLPRMTAEHQGQSTMYYVVATQGTTSTVPQ